MKTTESRETTTQHLTFFVGEQEYAVPVLQVREVVESMVITRVPKAPPAVRGVVNLRGSVVPVIDLGVRFGLAERPITKWTCIIVVMVESAGEQAIMGLLVDSVSEVIELSSGAIQPVPPFGAHLRVELLKGIGVVGPKFVLLLDIDRALSARDLVVAAALSDASPAEEGVTA